MDTKRNAAFVHALNLVERNPLCIDMPPCDKCTIAELRRWALALAPDGRTLLAANPAIGRVAEIDLPSSRIVGYASFGADPGAGETLATVSPDGERLLFSNGSRLWSYDTQRGSTSAAGVFASGIDDLAFGRDGTLFLARNGQSPLTLSPAA